MGTRKWVDLTVGLFALAHPGIGPMQPAEIRAHQEERAAEQAQVQLERDTTARTRSRYVAADSRPFGAGTGPVTAQRGGVQPSPAKPTAASGQSAPTQQPARNQQSAPTRNRTQRRDRSR